MQKKSRIKLTLTTQIFLALILGILLGVSYPELSLKLGFLRDIFLNLIKSIIAPLVFATLVVGIAGAGDLKKVGRMGAKTLLYFEIVTTLALVVGMFIANWVQPGKGVILNREADIGALASVEHFQPKTLTQTLVHIFPSSFFDSLAHNDVLQITFYSILFALAVAAVGDKGKPVVHLCQSLSQIMFQFTHFVMKFAPIGIGAAIAQTVAHQGLGILKNLGLLIGSLYLALFLFSILILLPIALALKIPILNFLRAIREPFTIAFVTTSSESALPKALENMENYGVPPHVVGFVLPTGYSFNLDGTTLYLALASLFIAQVAEASIPDFHFSLENQITMLITLMVTSKGIAGVPRASLVVLLATAHSFFPKDVGPLVIAMIFGIDEIMDMARTSINITGNCLASVVIAKWEGELDLNKAQKYHEPMI